MWFKNFLKQGLQAFNAFFQLGIGEVTIEYTWIGMLCVFSVIFFAIGVYKIIQIIINVIYDWQAAKKWRKK